MTFANDLVLIGENVGEQTGRVEISNKREGVEEVKQCNFGGRDQAHDNIREV